MSLPSLRLMSLNSENVTAVAVSTNTPKDYVTQCLKAQAHCIYILTLPLSICMSSVKGLPLSVTKLGGKS